MPSDGNPGPAVPAYTIVGEGRWGQKIAEILARRASPVTIIRLPDQYRGAATGSAAASERRDFIAAATSAVDVVWVAVRPGDDQIAIVSDALESGKNVIVEKPWLATPGQSAALQAVAKKSGLITGVHFQFCYAARVEELSRQYKDCRNVRFSGNFSISRDNRLDIPADLNLGIHLHAIRQACFPDAAPGRIESAYGATERRDFSLKTDDGEIIVDLLETGEPLVDRFINSFEEALSEGGPFALDLALGTLVLDSVMRQRETET